MAAAGQVQVRKALRQADDLNRYQRERPAFRLFPIV